MILVAPSDSPETKQKKSVIRNCPKVLLDKVPNELNKRFESPRTRKYLKDHDFCFFFRSSTTPVSSTTESPPPEITTTRFLDDALSEALSNLPEPLPLTAVAPVSSAPESVLPVAIEVDPCNASSHYVIANEPRRSFNQVRSLTLLSSFSAWLGVVFHGQMTPSAMEKCT